MAFQTWVDPAPTLFGTHTVEARPTFDAHATRQPFTTTWAIDDDEHGIVIGDYGESYEEERAIMEFQLPHLPDGAVVTGAQLRLNIYSSSGYPSIAAHPYMGNGTPDPTDAEQFSLPYYSSGPVTASDIPIIDLGPDAVRSAYENGLDYIGFMLRGETYFDAGAFSTMEQNLWGIDDGEKIPALLIDYEMPAIAGDLNGDGFVGIADLNIVLSNWNQTVPPGDPLADPNGDNFVGIADLNVVLGNWNAGTPPGETSNIPEPGTLILLGLGLAAMAGRSNRLA